MSCIGARRSQHLGLFRLFLLLDARAFRESRPAPLNVSGRSQQLPEHIVRSRIFGVQADRLAQRLGRFRQVAFLLEGRAQQVPGFRVARPERDRNSHLPNWIQEAHAKKAVGLVINPAGYTTTSIAILDALLTLKMPIVEIHVTNIHAREKFRQNSYVSKAAKAVICGFGINGYALAITGLAGMVGAKAKK